MPKLQSLGGTHDASTKNIFLKAWQLLEAGEMEETWGEAEETHGRRFCWGPGWRCDLRTHARGGTSLRGLQPATHTGAAENEQDTRSSRRKPVRNQEQQKEATACRTLTPCTACHLTKEIEASQG